MIIQNEVKIRKILNFAKKFCYGGFLISDVFVMVLTTLVPPCGASRIKKFCWTPESQPILIYLGHMPGCG